MKFFFLLVEAFVLILMPFMLITKKSLSVVYLPVFFFAYSVIDSALPPSFYQLLIICLLGYYTLFNLPFIVKNIFSVILVFYFIILLTDVKNLVTIRSGFLEIVTLFLLVGIIPEVYKRYTKEEIFKELSFSAFLILSIFVVNALFSTFFKFNPGMMYGISGGVLYGNIIFANFNIMPLACYLVFQSAIQEKKKIYLVVFFVSVFLILLTLRRTVMLLTVMGTVVLLVNLIDLKNLKKLIGLVAGILVVTFIVISSTGFLDMLNERIALRKLEEKNIEEEQRIQEIYLVYRDLFVYYDYSPWFGYGLLDAKGNYGKGVFGNRNLHTDLTVLVHSSGLLGLFLYLSMVGTVFLLVWRKTSNKFEFMQFVFISFLFSVFFITGRYNNVQSSILIYLILCIPLSLKNEKKELSKNDNRKLENATAI
jgi:hypothetical protein